MKTYIEIHREKILKAKRDGEPKEVIQKMQQEYDKLLERDINDIRDPYEFLYWN